MDQRPEVRIGTDERERAQNALNEHFSQGRLDMGEFEERSSLAAGARTFADLEPIFSDLPGGLAAVFPPLPVKAARQPRGSLFAVPRRTIPAAALLLLVVLLVLVSHGWMLFLLFPMSGALRHHHPPHGRRPPDGPWPPRH